jgi:carboxyl-terminal processing protease
MSKKLKALILTISVVVVLFAVMGGLLNVSASTNEGAYRQLGVFSEVLSRIQSEYVEQPNIAVVTSGALHGLLESLDANSSYLTPEEYKLLRSANGEQRGSLGASISKRFGYAVVVSVLPGSPADRAGVQGGDIVESIENETTRELSLAVVKQKLGGAVGSNVTLTMVRPRRAEPQKLTITRDNVSVPPAAEKVLEAGIGYVRVEALPKGKAQEIAQKIKTLQNSGAKKLILDLRDVSEGEMSEGIALADLFLERGTITYLQGQKHARENFAAQPDVIAKGPVVVLVNRGTAGAAEVAAAAILENARGDVVGDRTFGNGSVQKTIEIADGSAVILSVAKYYSPSGKAIQDVAVTPNIRVADAADAAGDVEDGGEEVAEPTADEEYQRERQRIMQEQLRRAIEVLKTRNA